MRSALDVALEKAEQLELIPRITDPMGRSWEQPKVSELLIDDTHVVMTRTTFNKLHEYSASQPTGVYPGKMWKRHDGGFDFAYRRRGGKPVWLLCWFGLHPDPKFVSNHRRAIIIVEDGVRDEGCSCCGREV